MNRVERRSMPRTNRERIVLAEGNRLLGAKIGHVTFKIVRKRWRARQLLMKWRF